MITFRPIRALRLCFNLLIIFPHFLWASSLEEQPLHELSIGNAPIQKSLSFDSAKSLNVDQIIEEIKNAQALEIIKPSYSSNERDNIALLLVTEALKHTTVLTQLSLSNVSFTSSNYWRLCQALAKIPLTELKLRNAHLGNEGTREVLGSLGRSSNLKCLDLSNNELTIIPDNIKKFDALEILKLGGNQFGDDLSNLLNLKNLKEINLKKTWIGNKGLKSLLSLPHLTKIYVPGCNISCEGVELLSSCSQLTSLNLSSNGIGAQELEVLYPITHLKQLVVKDNPIDDNAMRVLSTFTNLTSLSLWTDKLGDQGHKDLVIFMWKNSNLVNLTLRENGKFMKIKENTATSTPSGKYYLYWLAYSLNKNQISRTYSPYRVNRLENSFDLESLRTFYAPNLITIYSFLDCIAHHPYLTTLHLSNMNIGNKGARIIANSLMINSILIDLNLRNNGIRSEGAIALSNAFQRNTTLTSLNLSANPIRKKGLEALENISHYNTTVKVEVDKVKNKPELPPEIVLKILEYLPQEDLLRAGNISSLYSECAKEVWKRKVFKLWTTTLNQKQCKNIAKHFFQYLQLESCNLGDREATILSQSTKIKHLNLLSNYISHKGVKALALNTTLTSLNLEGNIIEYKGIQWLSQNKSLTSLGLGSTEIDDDEITLLMNIPTLKKIFLENNKITDKGAIKLAENSTLTELYLGNNAISNKSTKVLAQSNNLTALDLSHTSIDDEGAKGLALSTSLKDLYLDGNSIGDEGAVALAQNTILTLLSLHFTQISNVSVLALGENPNLRAIHISPVTTHIIKTTEEWLALGHKFKWKDNPHRGERSRFSDSVPFLKDNH